MSNVKLPSAPNQVRQIARLVSRVEDGDVAVLRALASLKTLPAIPVWGITGPPGAGKSTLVDQLIGLLTCQGKYVAVIAVDPSSPFSGGAILGDRIRMQRHATNSRVFIRSMATRGHMGGLALHTWEVVALLRQARFDYILVETVGVGQSEVDIMGIADVTAVVLVPESGDEIQHLKAGVMEIADLLVVNKADRPGVDEFIRRLQQVVSEQRIPIVPTQAMNGKGIEKLMETFQKRFQQQQQRSIPLLRHARQAYQLILSYRMRDVSIMDLQEHLSELNAAGHPTLNLLFAVRKWLFPDTYTTTSSSLTSSEVDTKSKTMPFRK